MFLCFKLCQQRYVALQVRQFISVNYEKNTKSYDRNFLG